MDFVGTGVPQYISYLHPADSFDDPMGALETAPPLWWP